MKRFNSIITASVAALFLAIFTVTTSGVSHALPACFTYGQDTSVTPVFNNICDVGQQLSSTEGAYPIGNERDFVRIRPSITGDNTVGSAQPKLANSVTSTCKTGDKFDVWTYIHNDATATQNTNGTGTAVAKNVKLALSANGVNTENSNFTFGSTISASNAETVNDTATLSCGGKKVKLTLVKNTLHYNNHTTTANGPAPQWTSLGDGYVNSTNAIGNPIFGSGDMYGCYDYRTVVVYTVTVEEVLPPPPAPVVTATCDLFKLETADDRTVKVSQFKYTATNATYKSTVINWDSTKTDVSSGAITDANKVVGTTHKYAADGTYNVTATVSFSSAATANIVASTTNCNQSVTFKAAVPPVVTTVEPTPTTPVAQVVTAPAAPTVLVNTGPGSVMALFATITVASAVAYRKFAARRLSA